jgi:sterol 3beta-glucosyltransferase
MRITILTYGSRGDVQPFIWLSKGLMSSGHSVKLVAPSRFQNLVEEQGIHFLPLAGDPAQLSRRLNDSGQNFIRMAGEIMDHAIEIGADVFHQTEEACKDADLIIHSLMHAVGAHTLAREMNIPDIHIELFPMFTSTGDYPNVTLPDSRFRALNRLTHDMTRLLTVWAARTGFEQVRRRAGLPRRKLYSPFDNDPLRPQTPILCAWSPRVLPASSDWSSNVYITGYFFGDFDDYRPPLELQEFLARGEPPVCITFGSMVNREAEKIDQIVRESLQHTNRRGIILSGWSELKKTSSSELLYLDTVPHQWLLPRCQMVIHHGGASTTSAGLRAGIPNIVIPFTGDQLFWGRRIHAIGAGPKPIPVKELSIENLTRAIIEAENYAIRKQALDIGRELRSEDGVGITVKLLEKYSNEFHRN